MRSTYYQSAENPIQLDRLPDSEPDIEFLPPAASLDVCLGALAAFLVLAAACVCVTLVFYQAPGITWLSPFDLLFAWPALVFSFAAWICSKRLAWLLSTPFLASVLLLAFNQYTPWGRQVLIVSLVAAITVYAFGRHWSAVCTAAPVSRSAADDFRQRSRAQLILLAAVTGLLIAGLLWTGAFLFSAGVLLLPVAAFVIPLPRGVPFSRWLVFAASLASWFTYEALSRPGLFQSPVAPIRNRWGIVLVLVVLTAAVLNRWDGSPLPKIIALGSAKHAAIQSDLTTRRAGTFERVRYSGLIWTLTLVAVVAVPILAPLCLVVSITTPVLLEAMAERSQACATGGAGALYGDLAQSTDPITRHSIYLGRVVSDGSPVLVPRLVFREHAHGLGDSGSGKTALFLCPVIEQLAQSGDCSVIVIDLKADSLELFATLRSTADTLREKRRLRIPVKFFSNQADKATFAFNPMRQVFWHKFDLLTRTDILCGANGLTYGTDYGAGYYSSANAAILYHALKTFPHVTTFTELADCIGEVITTARKRELHPEIRKAGVHVHEVMKRLAACDPLNVAADASHEPAIAREAIDFSRVFQEPQFHYFHLSATLSPSGAPEIARLATYMLLAAATQTERKVPVFLVIDEFQRMVASNLEYMLQLARSMGVGVIIANQSLEDLKKTGTNLIPAVEANCRLRQWFSVSCSEDQERIIKSSGTTVDYANSWSKSTNSKGESSSSHSQTEQVVNRITINDILLTNDHPFRSILRISRGKGYAQFGGMPVVIETEFHISPEEYQRRRELPWPTADGAFVPHDHRRRTAKSTPKPRPGPDVTSEVIDDGSPRPTTPRDIEEIDELFRQFHGDSPPEVNAAWRPER